MPGDSFMRMRIRWLCLQSGMAGVISMRSDAKRGKILDRVKKLLALSTSSNVNEAANAAAAAQKLMLEHKLTEADVSDTQEGQMFELSMGAAGFSMRWKFVLVTAVARSFFCEAVGLRVGQRRKVRIVGRREDVEIAARVFRHLHSEINRLAKIEIEAVDWDEGVYSCRLGLAAGIEHDPGQYLESFRRGAVAAVIAKFRTGEEDFVASDSRALVVASRGREQVREYVGSKFTDTRKLGPDDVVQVDDLAFVRGYEQAQVIVLPGEGSTSTAGVNPRKDSGRETTRSKPRDPAPGSPAEVFVKPSAKPAVDVVVTHAGSVPVVRPDQQGFHGEGAEPGEDVRTGEDQNGESIFNRLKKWWKAEN